LALTLKAPYLRFTAKLAVIYPALQLLREIKSDNGFISTVTRKLYFKELVKTASPREKLFFFAEVLNLFPFRSGFVKIEKRKEQWR
jgi:hypothetical protein